MQGRCIHGRYGKNCSNAHVPLCKLFIKSGELGCSKGIDCAYAHPKLCTRSLRHNECKRKKCFLYHVTGSSRPMFAQNKQIGKPNNEPAASSPCDKVNKPNPQTLPKPLPQQVPISKANASKTKPPVNPNIDLATMNSFLEKLTALQPQMENVVAQLKYFSQVVMPPRWTSNVPLQADVTSICPILPVLNPEHGPHMYNFLFLNIRRLLLKSGTDKTKIDFMKDLSNSYTLFICLCETFLNSSILNADIFMPGDRADRPGGGLYKGFNHV